MDEEQQQEEEWVLAQREAAEEYLTVEQVQHAGVGEWPAFHVYPYLAIWAVQSKITPGKIGWWVITGDCPTDYISGAGVPHPRLAMLEFSKVWKTWSTYMLEGKEPPDVTIGNDEDRKLLGDLLERRSRILENFANDPEIWLDNFDQDDDPAKSP